MQIQQTSANLPDVVLQSKVCDLHNWWLQKIAGAASLLPQAFYNCANPADRCLFGGYDPADQMLCYHVCCLAA